MVLNKDFREFIELLSEKQAKYLVVGGYAVAFHGYPRYTKDIDLWIWLNRENAEKVIEVLKDFGFSSLKISVEDLLTVDNVIQLGYPPARIDLLTDMGVLDFEECYLKKEEAVFEGLTVDFIDVESLIKTKLLAKRPQDIADIEKLNGGRVADNNDDDE